jgi:hypothetical protein
MIKKNLLKNGKIDSQLDNKANLIILINKRLLNYKIGMRPIVIKKIIIQPIMLQ